MRSAGFTLLEILVVLAIGALLLVLVMPNLPVARGRVDLLAGGQQVETALRRIRLAAIEQNRALAFDAALLPLPAGLRVAVEPESGLTFHPDGSSNGGRVLLANARGSLALDVDWLSGRVRHAR
jgi:general secretion pathway protein H